MVPYTAWLNAKRKPRWTWIDRWLSLKGESLAGGSQKFWDKTIRRRWAKRHNINARLATLLQARAASFPLYISIMAEAEEDSRKRHRMWRDVDDYRVVARRLMRFLKDF